MLLGGGFCLRGRTCAFDLSLSPLLSSLFLFHTLLPPEGFGPPLSIGFCSFFSGDADNASPPESATISLANTSSTSLLAFFLSTPLPFGRTQLLLEAPPKFVVIDVGCPRFQVLPPVLTALELPRPRPRPPQLIPRPRPRPLPRPRDDGPRPPKERMGRWAAAAAGAGAPDDGWSLEREDEPSAEGPEDTSLPLSDIPSRIMAPTCHPISSSYLIVLSASFRFHSASASFSRPMMP